MIRLSWLLRLVLVLLYSSDDITAERAYPLGCSSKDPKYYDFESATFPPNDVPQKTHNDYMSATFRSGQVQ